MYGFLNQWNVVRLETNIFKRMRENILKLKKYYAETFSKTTGIEIQLRPLVRGSYADSSSNFATPASSLGLPVVRSWHLVRGLYQGCLPSAPLSALSSLGLLSMD